MRGEAMPAGVNAKYPPRALHEVERLTRNPEKLANTDGRFWKDSLGRKRSFKSNRPPYPTRRGLVTAWQETKKLLHHESGQTMSGRTWRRKISKNHQDWQSDQKTNKKGSLEVSCESLIVGTADGREERRRRLNLSKTFFIKRFITFF